MKKERLKECSMEYLSILFIIWQLVTYYGKLYQIDAGNNPAKIDANIMEYNGISYVRFSFPKIERIPYKQLVLKMKHVYNEYLRYALLPECHQLKPFTAGTTYLDIMEALYVDKVYEDDSCINLEVIYVDNLEAYNYVRNDESEVTLWNF